LDAGMNDHIPKPINVQDMFSIMSKWITPSKQVAQMKKEFTITTNDLVEIPDLPGIDVAAGLSTCQGNSKLYKRLLIKFRESETDFANRFNMARNGDDTEATIRIAHTLKGMSGNIGAKKVQETAEKLEFACEEKKPKKEIDQLLKNVTFSLSEVLKGLIKLKKRDATEVLSDETLDQERFKALLIQLRELLEDDDTDSIETLETLKELPGIGIHKQILKQISKALEAYDFELASEELEKLETS
jgi:HPt (histidine-containing phosphotransfer) domain-containing protein